MNLPEVEWYTIAEVAKRWDVPEEHVDRYLEAGKLSATIKMRLAPLEFCKDGDTNFTKVRLVGGKYTIFSYHRIHWAPDVNGLQVCDLKECCVWLFSLSEDRKYRVVEPYLINKKEIRIMAEEIIRFEKKHTIVSEPDNAEQLRQCPDSYLNPNHPFYSEELATAVNVWLGIYGSGGKYKSKESHKAQIKKELMNCGLSKTAIDRIATLVNPNKDGGAPVIDS